MRRGAPLKCTCDLRGAASLAPTERRCLVLRFDPARRDCYYQIAGWSSLVARWAHNPKVAGSNPAPATNSFNHLQDLVALGTSRYPRSETAHFLSDNYGAIRLLFCARRLIAKNLPYNLAVGFPFRACHCPSVNIHRRLDRSMTH
jgi:hypothetical protein